MGLTYDQLFPGRFIKAGEMEGKATTLTIKDVYLDTLEGEDGREKQQAIVAFEQIKREMALNKTNAQCLLAMWGPDSGEWVGKRLTLYPENDTSGLSDSGVCIRVKGSPDLAKAVKATIKLPRRRPVERRLVPTGKNGDRPRGASTEATEEAQGEASPEPSGPADEPSEAELDETFGPQPEFVNEEEPPPVDENGEVIEPKPVSEWQRSRLGTLGWSDAAIAQMDHDQAKGYIDRKGSPQAGGEAQEGLGV